MQIKYVTQHLFNSDRLYHKYEGSLTIINKKWNDFAGNRRKFNTALFYRILIKIQSNQALTIPHSFPEVLCRHFGLRAAFPSLKVRPIHKRHTVLKYSALFVYTPMEVPSFGTFIFGKCAGWKCFGSASHSTVAFCHKDIWVAASRSDILLFALVFLADSVLLLVFRVHGFSISSRMLLMVLFIFLWFLSPSASNPTNLPNISDNSCLTFSISSFHSTSKSR